MRFLSMIRINENSGMVPSEKLMSDMGKLMEEMTKAGILLSTAGSGRRRKACVSGFHVEK